MSFSFWEYQYFNSKPTVIIIGSGIVGLSTAIELKLAHNEMNVVILDKYFPGHGASTKNAGFACFGSLTEVLDDLNHMSKSEVIDLVSMRWNGIKILGERLSKGGIEILYNGGKEFFSKGENVETLDLALGNDIMKQATGIEDYFSIINQDEFGAFNAKAISMPREGELNPMHMMDYLQKYAIQLGVKFIIGKTIKLIDFANKKVILEGDVNLSYFKLAICTNGFTKSLLPHIDVNPARNHVLVTEPIANLKLKGVYHYDKGYYYFRRVGDRILLGGARNFDGQNEMTSEFAFNEKIRVELTRFLKEELMDGQEVKIDYWWTGVLGISSSKQPIIKEVEKDTYLGVRLGGMGVAIGSYMGKQLTDLVLKE